MTNQEVQKRLTWLCERILRCMEIRCPEARANVWSTTSPDPFPRVAHFTEWGFKFCYDNSHCVYVQNLADENPNNTVFHFDIDTKEFYWNQPVVEEYVEEIVNRVLVLDRLAEIKP